MVACTFVKYNVRFSECMCVCVVGGGGGEADGWKMRYELLLLSIHGIDAN